MNMSHSPAELQNARDYLAEIEAMQAEARESGDFLTSIRLDQLRVIAIERVRSVRCAINYERSHLSTRAGACDEVPAISS